MSETATPRERMIMKTVTEMNQARRDLEESMDTLRKAQLITANLLTRLSQEWEQLILLRAELAGSRAQLRAAEEKAEAARETAERLT